MEKSKGLLGVQKKACSSYSKVYSNSIPKAKTQDDVDKGFSFSFAAGLKLDFKEKNGFSLKILTPQEIAEQENQNQKTFTVVAPQEKGCSINLYC